jgi:hypothetical protein
MDLLFLPPSLINHVLLHFPQPTLLRISTMTEITPPDEAVILATYLPSDNNPRLCAILRVKITKFKPSVPYIRQNPVLLRFSLEV